MTVGSVSRAFRGCCLVLGLVLVLAGCSKKGEEWIFPDGAPEVSVTTPITVTTWVPTSLVPPTDK